MSKETRDRIAFRMQPETRRRIEQWYAADNCQSKNEFIEKAVNFYVDYLGIQDNTTLVAHGNHVCHRRQAEQIGGLYRPQRFYQMRGAGHDQRHHRGSVRDGPG